MRKLVWLLLFALGHGAHAWARESIARTQFEMRYQRSKTAIYKPEVKELKTVLLLQRDDVPVKSRAAVIDIVDGQIRRAPENLDQRLKRGQLLCILDTHYERDRIELTLRTIDPKQIERGARRVKAVGIERHFYTAKFRFFFPENVLEKEDLQAIYKTLDEWFLPFPDIDQALRYREQAPGKTKEIKEGMTVEEVERTLGTPERKFAVGEKLIYQYQDVKIEFKDNKVTDVKF